MPTMKTCAICEHAKIKAINAALDCGRAPNLVRAQYRLEEQMFKWHLAHRAQAGLATQVQETLNHLVEQSLPSLPREVDGDCQCSWCRMPAYRRLLRAWDEASREEKTRFCLDTREVDVPF
jgi:hypothetical protein